MKRIGLFLTACLLFVWCSGCDDFLSSKSLDLIIPKTAAHYFEILRGDYINQTAPTPKRTGLMTDEVGSVHDPKASDRDNRMWDTHLYLWQDDSEFSLMGEVNDDGCWLHYYKKVLLCNTVLDQVAQGDLDGTEGELRLLEAECYFFRAQAYLHLVNLYADPYENEEQAKTEWGVPLNLASGVQQTRYQRSKLADVYAVITGDIKNSIELFDKHGKSRAETIFRPSYVAANQLAGRIFLYMKDYVNAKKYTEEALTSTTATLWDLNGEVYKSSTNSYISTRNKGIIYNYGSSNLNYPNFTKTRLCWKISDKFIEAFVEGDLRKTFFVSVPEIQKYWVSDLRGEAFRIEELYLNLAECLIAENDWKGAIKEVNRIREKRFATGTDYELVPENKEEALEMIKNERFIELSFEDHRWFDLRRWGRPRLVHRYDMGSDQVLEYVLEENSPNYTLSVPRKVLEANPEMIKLKRQGQKSLPGYGETANIP